MPAFPHGLVNYSSGFLKTNLAHFVLATFIGISLKSYVYTPVIYQAAGGASLDDLLNIATFGPLVLLSLVIVGGGLCEIQMGSEARYSYRVSIKLL